MGNKTAYSSRSSVIDTLNILTFLVSLMLAGNALQAYYFLPHFVFMALTGLEWLPRHVHCVLKGSDKYHN